MQFPFNLPRITGKRNLLQVARDMLHIAMLGCNLQWFQEFSATTAKSKTVRFNFATCAAMVLRDKLQVGCSM